MEDIVTHEYAEEHEYEELFDYVREEIKEWLPALDSNDKETPAWIIAYLLGDIAQSLRDINCNIFDYITHN